MSWLRFWRRNTNDGTTKSGAANARRPLDDRRRLKEAPYVLPSDDKEINRLDFQHYMLRYTLRGNFAARSARLIVSQLRTTCSDPLTWTSPKTCGWRRISFSLMSW